MGACGTAAVVIRLGEYRIDLIGLGKYRIDQDVVRLGEYRIAQGETNFAWMSELTEHGVCKVKATTEDILAVTH